MSPGSLTQSHITLSKVGLEALKGKKNLTPELNYTRSKETSNNKL